MACYHPLRAYRLEDGSVTFRDDMRGGGDTLELPCGKCVGCLLERRRQWSIRIVHEASLWPFNCAVTLTYDDEHLPPCASLDYVDFQKFMRSLRDWGRHRKLPPIRFFCCAEYGSHGARPHYHAVLFNFFFADREPSGKNLYRSRTLEELWRLGFSSVGDVTPQTAAYVAGYVTKKAEGSVLSRVHTVVDRCTGELVERRAEFCRMSNRPGIGAGWLERFGSDVYPHGKVVFNGREVKPPKFYDRRFAEADPDSWAELQAMRYRDGIAFSGDNTRDRLATREAIALARVASLKREL